MCACARVCMGSFMQVKRDRRIHVPVCGGIICLHMYECNPYTLGEYSV